MSAYTAFDGDLALIPSVTGWRAIRPLRWEVGAKGSGVWLEVPAAFVSDGPSIPWWARWALDPVDPHFAKAARLHDFALAQGWSAWTAAAIFHDALGADGVGCWTRWTMALAVLLHVAGTRSRSSSR